jgi:hypothetical protein
MDPISATGLGSSIIALYSTSRDCYIFFTTVKSAEKGSLIHLREFDIQQSILKAWGFYWDIQRHDVIVGGTHAMVAKENSKLIQFLERNNHKAHGVMSALCAISDTLSNGDKLINRYGLKLNPNRGHEIKELEDGMAELVVDDSSTSSTIQITVTKVRQRLSEITKCRWAIKDREKFQKLIADLQSYNDALYRLCPDGAFEAMNIHMTLECLSKQESFIGLRRTLKLANQLLENNEMSPSRGGLQMLASAAELKAKVVKLRRAGPLPEETEMDDMVNPKQLKDLGRNLALLNGKVVYVERKSYQMKESEYSNNESRAATADLEMRADILKLCNTLRNVDSWKNFLSLKPIGLVDYVRGRHKYHIGLIYDLPGTLGTPSRSVPAEDTSMRAPRTLTQLQHGHDSTWFALGARFELARKVFRAVVFLHASGWLHKNIRSSSIIVFPKLDKHGRYIKLDDPYLARYNFSRPDDVDEDGIRKFEEDSDDKAFFVSRTPFEVNLDYYHHPDKRASPKRLYRYAYDVYSLGIVLLEIGLWSHVHDLIKKSRRSERQAGILEDPYEFRRHVIAKYVHDLRYICGDIYANVVRKCLMVDADDSEVGEASQRALCARIAADLSECRA